MKIENQVAVVTGASSGIGMATARLLTKLEFQLPPPESTDYVAKKIVEAITSEKAEIFAHDWMNHQN